MVDVDAGDFTFSSNFDSGNLADASVTDPDGLDPSEGIVVPPTAPLSIPRRSATGPTRQFYLTIAPDCADGAAGGAQTGHRSWFYFSVVQNEARPSSSSSRASTRSRAASSTAATPVATPMGIPKRPSVRRPAPPIQCRFTIVNLSAANRIFDYDNRPVYRTDADPRWQRLPRPLDVVVRFPDGTTKTLSDSSQLAGGSAPTPTAAGSASSYARKLSKKVEQSTLRISWTFSFSKPDEVAYFAMCYPYSYKHQLGAVDKWQAKAAASDGGIYFAREVLALSLQGRLVELLTITGSNGASEEREPFCSGTAPVRTQGCERPFCFPEKPHVLLTSRVHPGETPASHVLQGVIDFLLSGDARAAALRRHFVFKIVPMINPDGVALGHYRMDSRGVNLNRCYDAPTLESFPTIHAVRDLFLSLARTTRLFAYLDLHAHASKRGCFVFANAWEGHDEQVENMLFPKLLSLHSPHFDFPSCDFTSRSMTTKNRRDGVTKTGTGRVALAMEAKLIPSYTFEASYNTGLPTSSAAADRKNYTTEVYSDIGKSIALSLLDMAQIGAPTRLSSTPMKDVDGVRAWIASQLRQFYASESSARQLLGSRAVPGAGAGTQHNPTKRLAREALATKLALPALNAAACRGVQLSLTNN